LVSNELKEKLTK